MQCQETAGFLFSHVCSEAAAQTCSLCKKGICDQHSHPHDNGMACSACAKKEIQRGQRQGRRGDDRYYHDDPFFYGSYHYSGWGYYHGSHWGSRHHHHSHHDPHDFTEADSENVGGLAGDDDADFEQDMGAS